MEVFKPIKVENYHFMDSGLDQYEPLLLYIRDAGWSPIEVDREGLGITDLEKRIEKLEEGFRKIELKVERYIEDKVELDRGIKCFYMKIVVGRSSNCRKLEKIKEMVELGADRVQVTILLHSLHRSLTQLPQL